MRGFKLGATVAVAFFAANGPVGAQTANPAQPAMMAAFDRGDFKTALNLAQLAAEKGDPEAQQIMALMYDNGWGAKQDSQQAALWYQKAAAQGLEAAQNNLAGLYVNGRGVARDYAKAAYWYGKAADQGALQAYYNLGQLYENGQGVPQDYKRAAEFYRRAASGALSAWYRQNAPRR